jgi:hypothetical protein
MPDEEKVVAKDLEANPEIPSPGGEEEDEVFAQAKDLFATFVKTIKAFRLYPPENPSLSSFRDQIYRKFQEFLKRHHTLFIKVNEYNLTYQGKILYENRDLKTSLAFLMYKDGLRELRFIEGLEQWELEALIDIFRQTDFINQLEDDLVTLIWEKDFVHISYLATDVFLDEMAGIIPENVEQFRQNMISTPLGRNVDVDLMDEEDLEGEQEYFDLLSRKVEHPPAVATNRNVYFLTADELERLRREVNQEISPTSVFHVIDILFEILAFEKNPEAFQDAVNVLMKLLDALLTLGEFHRAADLITRAHIILKTYELKDWQREIIQGLIEYGGDSDRLERIRSFLEKGQGIRWEEANQYLLLLTPRSIPGLIKILGETSNSKARRLFCDVLVQLGRNHLEQITPFIDDARWYLVRNIAYILGRIGKEAVLPALQKAMNHREVRVRREAIQSLGFIGGPRAFQLLVKALNDEDVRVRSIAALNLAKVGKNESQPYLLGIIQSKEFAKKEPAEKKAFLDAMGMIDPSFSLQAMSKKVSSKTASPESSTPLSKTVPIGTPRVETPGPMEAPPYISTRIPKEGRPATRVVSAKRPVPIRQSSFRRVIRGIFHIFSTVSKVL